jgi:hypothetical protein
MRFTVARTIGFLVGSCAFAQAQNLTWTLLQPSGTQPSARYDGTIAYDVLGRQVILFGGQDSSGTRNDLWVYSLDRQKWSQLQPAGVPPPPRFGHSLVYDSARRRVILFGGQAGSFFSDVWAYDIAANQWNQLSPNEAGPSSRYGHGAIYETAKDRMVISHGFTTAGRFDDTWAFDFSDNSWKNLTPVGSKPLKRCLHHAVYDSGRGQMYLYGGCASGFGPCPLGDLWAFDLNTDVWQELTPASSPAPRYHYGMSFDDSRSRLVLFGGFGGDLLGDTWDFNSASGLWQSAALTGVAPTARQRQESTFASGIGTIMFGGQTAQGNTNELWILSPPSLSVVDSFSGVGGSVAPGELVSIFGSGLGPATGMAQAFDPITGKLPVSAGGVTVMWNGVPAPLYFVAAEQLNVQVPYEVSGSTQATLTVRGVSSTVPVAPTHPGVFPVVFNSDFTVNSASNPAARGSTIILFVTGQGVTSPASVTGQAAIGVYPDPVAAVTVSNAQVVFKGQAPYTAGVMQVNAVLDATAPVGNAVPVGITVGGSAAQDLVIAIK